MLGHVSARQLSTKHGRLREAARCVPFDDGLDPRVASGEERQHNVLWADVVLAQLPRLLQLHASTSQHTVHQ